jgi:RecB family endonuclease NucS
MGIFFIHSSSLVQPISWITPGCRLVSLIKKSGDVKEDLSFISSELTACHGLQVVLKIVLCQCIFCVREGFSGRSKRIRPQNDRPVQP